MFCMSAASLSSASTPVGCILTGWLMDAIGRRRALLLTELPLALGWMLIALAPVTHGLHFIYAGRLLVGLGSGMVGAPARVYTGEVTQPHLRGTLSAFASVSLVAGSVSRITFCSALRAPRFVSAVWSSFLLPLPFLQVGVSLGVLLEYAVGSCVTWRVLAGLSAAVPTLALLLTLLTPESPAWLVSRGRHQEARAALLRVRGEVCDVQQELDAMRDFAERNNVVSLSSPSFLSNGVTVTERPERLNHLLPPFCWSAGQAGLERHVQGTGQAVSPQALPHSGGIFRHLPVLRCEPHHLLRREGIRRVGRLDRQVPGHHSAGRGQAHVHRGGVCGPQALWTPTAHDDVL